MRDDFAVFILSHGRADRLVTLNTLKRSGYTGKWYIILDNEDATINEYINRFGKENIIIFDKKEKAKHCDTMDNIDKRNIVLFARNSCHEIAKSLGLTYFLELDDDYNRFEFRYEEDNKLKTKEIESFDEVCDCFLDFLEISNAKTIAFAQGGDLIGGLNGARFKAGLLRKAMNSFFCKTDRPFEFYGRINEDANAYTLLGSRGDLFLTYTKIDLVQMPTQQNSGGLTESYLELGTYIKSFYTTMMCPSCSKIAEMGAGHARIHHRIDWEHAVPKIISSDFKLK